MPRKLRTYCLDSRVGPSKPQPPSASWKAEQMTVGVDERAGKAGAILGFVVAQAGPFKSEGRGRFDEDSLQTIIDLWPSDGATTHAQHASFENDGLLDYLGRAVSPRRSTAVVIGPDGNHAVVPAVRADLVFDPAARHAPGGDLVKYFTERAKTDPGSLSSSLVLAADIDEGYSARQFDPEGYELPPLWHPTMILSSDIVDTGDAVGSLLGFPGRDGQRVCLCPPQPAKSSLPAIHAHIPLFAPRLDEQQQQYVAVDRDAVGGRSVVGVPIFFQGKQVGKVSDSVSLNDEGAEIVFEPVGKLGTYAVLLHEQGRANFVPHLKAERVETKLFRQRGHRLDGYTMPHVVRGSVDYIEIVTG